MNKINIQNCNNIKIVAEYFVSHFKQAAYNIQFKRKSITNSTASTTLMPLLTRKVKILDT